MVWYPDLTGGCRKSIPSSAGSRLQIGNKPREDPQTVITLWVPGKAEILAQVALWAVSLSCFPPWLQLSCHADVCTCSKMCYTSVGYRWTKYPESTAWTLLIRHNTGLSEQAKRQHLTHAAGKLLLASGAERMTSTKLPLIKLQMKINSRKILSLFLFHPDILFYLSQHADAVKQVTKILWFRGLGHLPSSLPRRQRHVLPPPSHTLSHCVLVTFKTLKMKRNNIFGSLLSPWIIQ